MGTALWAWGGVHERWKVKIKSASCPYMDDRNRVKLPTLSPVFLNCIIYLSVNTKYYTAILETKILHMQVSTNLMHAFLINIKLPLEAKYFLQLNRNWEKLQFVIRSCSGSLLATEGARGLKHSSTHHFPGGGVVLEQGVRELHGHTLLVVGVLVLGDAEENGGSIGGWERGDMMTNSQIITRTHWLADKVRLYPDLRGRIKWLQCVMLLLNPCLSFNWVKRSDVAQTQ